MHTEISHYNIILTEIKQPDPKINSRKSRKRMQFFPMMKKGNDMILTDMLVQRKYLEDRKQILMKSLRTWDLGASGIYLSRYSELALALVVLIDAIHLGLVLVSAGGEQKDKTLFTI